MNELAARRALELTEIFIELNSLSISSMNWMMKAITLFLSRSSKLEFVIKKLMSYPSMGFLRRMTNWLARLIRNREKILQRISSRVSICLILILIRTELRERSIKHCSFSVRQMWIGLKTLYLLDEISTSGLVWQSTVSEGKDRRVSTQFSVLLMQSKYGLRVLL